jgi:hypothetical protein
MLVRSDEDYQETWDYLSFEGEESHEIIIDGTQHLIALIPVPENNCWIGQVFHDGVSGTKAEGKTRDVVFDLLLKEARWSRDSRFDMEP